MQQQPRELLLPENEVQPFDQKRAKERRGNTLVYLTLVAGYYGFGIIIYTSAVEYWSFTDAVYFITVSDWALELEYQKDQTQWVVKITNHFQNIAS